MQLFVALGLLALVVQPAPVVRPRAIGLASVVVTARGVGYPPSHLRGAQARLMARRAAEVAAVRNLAAKLGLPPSTRIGSFRYVDNKSLPDGGVEVTVTATVVQPARKAPGGKP